MEKQNKQEDQVKELDNGKSDKKVDSGGLVEKKVSAQLVETSEDKPLISDDKIINYYEDAMNCIKDDRSEAHDRYLQFCEMVVNGGDPSSASKEALVNLLKLKNDSVNQMIKILDLWTRVKLKERSTSSQVYAYQQNNKYEISDRSNHVKKLIEIAQQMESDE